MLNGNVGGERRALAAVFGVGIVLALAGLAVCGALDGAWAQANPFGGPRPPAGQLPPAPPAADGIVGWILAKQNEFYRQFSGLIRAAKADGSAAWTLFGVSFLYGIFHAAGPGHGKAVISSYVVANEETWRRGVVLSFASAILQAVVAVAIVSVAALLFQASRAAICNAEYWIEIVSYALIAVIGARLTWSKGRGFIAALAGPSKAHDHGHHHSHGHAHRHAHDHHHGHAHHGHEHHDHDDHSGHSHGPEPKDLAGPGGWRRGLGAIVAVGLRPCSGAIIVLVFALAQGLFWAGVVSTFVMGIGTAITVAVIATIAILAKDLALRIASSGSGKGTLALRAIEAAAAVAVLFFGVALLAGYLTAERIAVAC